MSVIEISSHNLLRSYKQFMTTVIEGGLVRFTYKGKTFKIVEEKPMTQGEKLAQVIEEITKDKPVNDEVMEEEDIKKLMKSYRYE